MPKRVGTLSTKNSLRNRLGFQKLEDEKSLQTWACARSKEVVRRSGAVQWSAREC